MTFKNLSQGINFHVVYDLTLSYNPKKDFCHQDLSQVKAIGIWRKERIITIIILIIIIFKKKIIIRTETIAVLTHQVVTAN